jgi:hypothetical protein
MRKVLPAAVAIAAVAGLALAFWWASSSHPTDGPMPVTDGIEVSFEADVDEAVSWGTPLPGVGSARVTLRSVELMDVQNLDIVDVGVCRTDPTPGADGLINHCAPINADGWPPAGVDPEPVAGTEVVGSEDPLVDLIVGVRRSGAAPDPGTIGSVRIVYEADGVTYEVRQPWALRLVPPGTLPTS